MRPTTNLLRNLINTGTIVATSDDTRRRVRIINTMTLVILTQLPLALLAGLWVNMPLEGLGLLAAYAPCISVVLVLNAQGHNVAARIWYLGLGYCFIGLLIVLFGGDLNYQNFLVPAMGMALLCFGPEHQTIRWPLALWAVPEWLLLDFYAHSNDAWMPIPDQYTKHIATVNNLFMAVTTLAMFFIFARISEGYLRQVEKDRSELDRYNSRLSGANTDLRQVINGFSHELKSPLRGIVALIEFIEEDCPQLDSELAQNIQRIKTRALTMYDRVEGMFRYTTAVGTNDEIASINLRALIAEVAGELEASPQTRLELPDPAINIETDRLQFKHVLSNLIENAIIHGHTHNSTELSVRYESDAEFHFIDVADNGPGIPTHEQESIFGLFRTAHARPSHHHPGIGLAIVQSLVRRNGGRVVIRSPPGEGCHVHFSWRKAG